MSKNTDPMIKHLQPLVGKTVTGLCIDDSKETLADLHRPLYGLRFSDGSIAWILQDPEGNGPGFLEIQTS